MYARAAFTGARAARRAVGPYAKRAYAAVAPAFKRHKRKIIAGSFVPGVAQSIYGAAKRRKTAPRAGKNPTRRVGTYGGKFKKAKKGKTNASRVLKNHVEIYGTCSTKNAVYHGYLTSGGRRLLTRQYCDSLLKNIIKAQGVSISDRDQPILWGTPGDLQRIELGFVDTGEDGVLNVLTPGSIDLSDNLVNFSFDKVRDAMLEEILSRMYSDRRKMVSWTLFENTGGVTRPCKINRNLGDSHFTCTVLSKFKVQNQTASDGDSKSTNRVDSNPLEGKLYTFKGGPPKLRQQFQYTNNGMQFFQQDDQPNGLILAPSDAGDVYDSGNELFSPPQGKTNFSNCTSQSNITIQPGNFKMTTSKYVYSGTVNNFFKRMVGSTTTRYTMGDTTLIGLEPSMRTSDVELVTIAYNLEFDSYSKLTPKIRMYLQQSNLSANVNGL